MCTKYYIDNQNFKVNYVDQNSSKWIGLKVQRLFHTTQYIIYHTKYYVAKQNVKNRRCGGGGNPNSSEGTKVQFNSMISSYYSSRLKIPKILHRPR